MQMTAVFCGDQIGAQEKSVSFKKYKLACFFSFPSFFLPFFLMLTDNAFCDSILQLYTSVLIVFFGI